MTPPEIDLAVFPDRLSQALEAGDVACLQLRLKAGDAPAEESIIRKAVERLRPICHNHDVALILNDDPVLAAELDCDGVHVGQQDAPYEEARRIVGPDAIVGVTCHNSRHLAMSAAEQGADYVAFGAFFPTHTKQARTQADIELLSWWAELMEVPVVAIGGITIENCRPLVEAGADFLAVVGGVWNHPDGPAAAVAAFNRIFDEVEAATAGKRGGKG